MTTFDLVWPTVLSVFGVLAVFKRCNRLSEKIITVFITGVDAKCQKCVILSEMSHFNEKSENTAKMGARVVYANAVFD